MKRIITAAALLCLAAGPAFADSGKTTQAAAKTETATVQGEIVDMGCYMGHGAKGAGHKECALKCISNGMPMGLLTSDGTLYLLTMSHENADPFNAAKKMAAETVQISGPVHEANGTKSLQVDSVELVKSGGAKG